MREMREKREGLGGSLGLSGAGSCRSSHTWCSSSSSSTLRFKSLALQPLPARWLQSSQLFSVCFLEVQLHIPRSKFRVLPSGFFSYWFVFLPGDSAAPPAASLEPLVLQDSTQPLSTCFGFSPGFAPALQRFTDFSNWINGQKSAATLCPCSTSAPIWMPQSHLHIS